LREPYIGPEGVFTGSARLAQEAKEKAAERLRRQEIDRRSREADRKRREITAQIAVLQAQLEENDILIQQEIEREDQITEDWNTMASSRRVTSSSKATVKMPGKPKSRLVQE
jgi:circadian clock protein KaiC